MTERGFGYGLQRGSTLLIIKSLKISVLHMLSNTSVLMYPLIVYAVSTETRSLFLNHRCTIAQTPFVDHP
jgi:hypothetical protein